MSQNLNTAFTNVVVVDAVATAIGSDKVTFDNTVDTAFIITVVAAAATVQVLMSSW